MQNVSIDLDVYVLHIDIYYVLTLYYSNTFTPLWQTVFFPRSHFIGCIKPCVFSILHLYKTIHHWSLRCFWCQTKSEQATAIYTRLWELIFGMFCQTYLHPSTCRKKRGLFPFNLFQFSQLRIKTYWFWPYCDIHFFQKNKLFWTKFSFSGRWSSPGKIDIFWELFARRPKIWQNA